MQPDNQEQDKRRTKNGDIVVKTLFCALGKAIARQENLLDRRVSVVLMTSRHHPLLQRKYHLRP